MPADHTQPTPPANSEPSTPAPCVVVGLGASAGGLEALQDFFGATRPDSGFAFVVIAHMDPNHASLLPELLQRVTDMQVGQIEDGEKVLPNHVYVVPPNCEVGILNGALQLLGRTPSRSLHLPIDAFFRSLAQDQGSNAVGVILSGTGTDGTLGVKALKEHGGLVMVQDQASAKYDGMPRSAVATGVADYVLAPKEMPAQLITFVESAGHRAEAHHPTPPEPFMAAVQKIIVLLRTSTGHDFSQYRKNTIFRRVERRMSIHQLQDIQDYVRLLRASEDEITILFKELLIGVTSFFRDPEAFGALKDEALLGLLRDKPDDYSIRVWVPGCSTGEEAYSVAILLHECMRELNRNFGLQVFGTDIDADAIDVARVGNYPANIASDVDSQWLQRYFTKNEGGGYRIRKAVRDTLVFAPQNILADPPFTKLDLLTCRNLLIYFEPELQKKLLPVLHYSLKPGGILFLGSSETTGGSADLFTPLSNHWKLFQRAPSSAKGQLGFHFPVAMPRQAAEEARVAGTRDRPEGVDPFDAVEAILSYGAIPPCAVIDRSLNIVYLHGRTGRFLEPGVGAPTLNILDMARPGLKDELAAAIRAVATHMEETVRHGVRVKDNGGHATVDVTVRPILSRTASSGLMMVVFEETASKPPTKRAGSRRAPAKGKKFEELEEQLRKTRESLQATIEELQTSNEEFKSTNEELQSTNEELQSTNEELETSKEELQSLNEESLTANAELQSRLDQLAKAHDDMKNLLDSTDIAVIFLDLDLRVRRFTPRVNDFIPLTYGDVGRPISHFASELVDVDISKRSAEVLDNLSRHEVDVRSRDGRWFAMRIRPYRTTENVIDGVAIVFQDVTILKTALTEAVGFRDYAERIAATVRESLLVLDADMRVVSANPAFYRTFQADEERTVGTVLFELGGNRWDIPELRLLLADVLRHQTKVEAYELEAELPGVGRRKMVLNAGALSAGSHPGQCILLAIGQA